MARIPQVTRTVEFTDCKCLFLNLIDETPFTKSVRLVGEYTDAKKLKKALERVANTDTEHLVKVKSFKTDSIIYAMTEQKFIELATPITKRVSNFSDNQTTENNIQ